MKSEPIKELNWIKCKPANQWCKLYEIDSNKNEEYKKIFCVYIVWHNDIRIKVLKVGQGNMKMIILENQKDKRLVDYEKYGLYMTFARIATILGDKVEVYLDNFYNPEFKNEDLPDVTPIRVSIPF